MKKLFFALAGLAFFSFCKKSDLSTTPEIEFVRASSTSLKAGKDALVLTISYRDGDGDLGENNPDVRNCIVQDSRDSALKYELRILQLAPTGSTIAIQGELDLELPATGLINDQNTSESATFSISVTDRAGHASNVVTSPSITILK